MFGLTFIKTINPFLYLCINFVLLYVLTLLFAYEIPPTNKSLINTLGDANIYACEQAKDACVQNYVYISAQDSDLPEFILRGVHIYIYIYTSMSIWVFNYLRIRICFMIVYDMFDVEPPIKTKNNILMTKIIAITLHINIKYYYFAVRIL